MKCRFVGDQSILEPGQYVLMANYTAYPYSRGSMHITGPDFDDALDFDVGFFSDPGEVDLKKQVWAYKKQREFMRRTKMFRGEVALGHPKFSATSKAALVGDVSATGLNGPDVQDLEYTAEDDKAIEQFLRENIQTTWHSLGSCKMAPREEMGAVDDKLNVYGVQNLKVADLSIPPENVGANTNNVRISKPQQLDLLRLTNTTDCAHHWREGCRHYCARAWIAEELKPWNNL